MSSGIQTRLLATTAQAVIAALFAATSAHAANAPPATSADAEAADASAEAATDVDAIIVTGTVRSAVTRDVGAGALGTRSALETPFSVSAVTADEIKDLQVKDINGIFRNDASVTQWNSGQSQASGAQFRVRGLSIDQLNGYKIDGLSTPYWSIDFPLQHFDQVQLLKGATGFMYGFGGPGGIVNFVAKRPTQDRLFNVSLGYTSDSLLSEGVDLGGQIGDRFGYRLNGFYEDGETFNGGQNTYKSVSLATDIKLTDRLTLTLDGFYMNTLQLGQVNTISVTAGVTSLQPVDGTTPLGAAESWKTNDMYVFTSTLNYEINDDWSATLSYRYANLDEAFPGNTISIFNNRGDYNLSAFYVQRVFDYNQWQGTVTGRFDTGPLSHDLIAGVGQQTSDYFSDAASTPAVPLGVHNLYSGVRPSLAGYPPSRYAPRLYLFNKYEQTSVFAADTIGWGDWSLLLGGRYTIYRDTVRDTAGRISAIYDEKPFTPTVALTYAIEPSTRIYASYVEGLQNGGQAGTTNLNYPETFPPIVSKQGEVGIKTQQSNWGGTLAAFRVEQDAGYVTPTNYYVQDGVVRYQGVEVSGSWQPLDGLTLAGSYRFLDATYTKNASSLVGKQVPGAPRIQAVASVAYLVPQVEGLSLSATVKHTGEGYGNTTNTLRFPAYTLTDLGVGYATRIAGRDVRFRGAVKNVSDEKYFTYGSSTIQPGDPRTYQAGIDIEF